MATKREGTARKRRPVKKTAAKKAANSKIGEAQAAANQRRKERDMPRSQPGPIRGPVKKGSGDSYSVGEGSALGPNQSLSDAANNTAILARQAANNPANKGKSGQGNQSLSEAAKTIVGLAAPLQAQAKQEKLSNPLSYVGLYGGPPKDRAKRISDGITATAEAATAQAKSKGQAVWMGTVAGKVKTRVVGDMPDERGADTYLKTNGEQILTKSVLMSWLTDPAKVDQIMKVAQDAGLAVTTYEDAAKLWGSVVDQAGDSYSLTGKKVTPWSLIQLRGKYAVNGKPADKVTTTTNIDEMSPAEARLMFEQTAQQQLGRAPTKAEVDDFIAKAQTIAKEHPTVTKSTQKIGFDGNVTDTTNVTTGGGADAASQLAAMDQAKQSEDYAAYQAAGNYFPMLFDALQSPV